MLYIVSLSGGVSSAVAADLAIKRYGRNRVWLWFADTLAEDEDLHRFVNDCLVYWDKKLIRFCDGRTPRQVAEDKQIIPNQKYAPCTYELKIKPFTGWLWRVPKPVTVLLGFSWSEIHRIDQRHYYHKKDGNWRRPTGYQARVPGVFEDYPLLWKPIIHSPFQYVEQEMGIEMPQMYRDGYDHNNCGGECWKQSIKSWLITRNTRPKTFYRDAGWEIMMQKRLGTNHTIVRDQSNGTVAPLTLMELSGRKRVRRQPGDDQQYSMFEDNFTCVCGV